MLTSVNGKTFLPCIPANTQIDFKDLQHTTFSVNV